MTKKIKNYSKLNIKKYYKENGYFIFRNVINKKYIKESLKEIDLILKSQWKLYFKSNYPGKDIAIKKLFYRNKNYRKFLYEMLNKRMLGPIQYTKLDIVKKICSCIGIKTPLFQDAANRFHIPGEKIFQTGTHQDIGIMKTNNSVTFWLPLIKSALNSGSLKFWKKSHLENVIIPDGPDYRGHTWINKSILEKYEEVWEEYMPGDLVMIHTKIIHTSMPNNSKNCRWAVIFRFDDLSDNRYFDLKFSPLSVGYRMFKDENRYTGFKKKIPLKIND
jgi:ectoine hydroxylase-related dioxygenase (phytanoyl-CoA dioxygenase family)